MEHFEYAISAALEELHALQAINLRGDMDSVCKAAAELGYVAVELHIHTPKQYDAGKLRAIADSRGVSVSTIAPGAEYFRHGLSLIADDPEVREAAVTRMMEHVELAQTLGSMVIFGCMRGNIPWKGDAAVYMRRFREAVERICEYAQKKNVHMLLENINFYANNFLRSIPETMDFIMDMGIDNLSLHMDTHSMWIEDDDLKDSILYCKGKPLRYVHYSDSNRYYPGGGAINFLQVTNALMEIGYRGLIAIETFPFPNAYESAKRAIEYSKAIETACRIARLPKD